MTLPGQMIDHGSAAKPRATVTQVSLVIPLRDEASTVEYLIQSVRGQSRKPDEVIFVDGGSRDGTLEILRHACEQDATFRLIPARKTLPDQARNIGGANARFSWVAFTYAGNPLNPHLLQTLSELTTTALTTR